MPNYGSMGDCPLSSLVGESIILVVKECGLWETQEEGSMCEQEMLLSKQLQDVSNSAAELEAMLQVIAGEKAELAAGGPEADPQYWIDEWRGVVKCDCYKTLAGE